MTVNGPIQSDDLGITHPHEHVFLDIEVWFDRKAPKRLAESPVRMEILSDLRWKDGQNRDNMVLDSLEEATAELTRFKTFGGKSLVDLTLPGIGRAPKRLLEVSRATGLNIVCGTGYYIAPSHPAYVKRKSPEQLAEVMVKELEEGIEDTGVRAGVIGEMGCQEPLEASEAKALEAAAMAQVRTKAALTIHTALHDAANKRIAKQVREEISILQKHDCDLSKVYISHMDFTYDDPKYQRQIMDEYGVTLSYDTFGQEQHYNNVYAGALGVPDSARARAIFELVKSGYAKQLMMSCDVCEKIHLKRYGGYGYANVLENIVPVLKEWGLTEKHVRTMMVENPRKLLAK